MAINFLTTTNTLPEIQINDTGDNPRLELQESGIVSGGISTTGGDLVFEASSGVERARIDSVGRLMVNTTTPFVNAAVTAVGISGTNVAGVFKSTDNQAWISVQDDDSGTYGALFGTDSDLGLDIILANRSATNRLVIDTSGKVGIGTNSPSATLHVKSSGNGEVNIERASGTLINLQAQSALGVIGTNSNHNLAFKANSNVGMVLTTAGKVGIGTTSPSLVALHVKAGDEATLKLESTSGEPAIFWAPGSSSLKWEQRASASRWQLYQYDEAEWVFNIYDAKVGIGTVSPSYKLDVDGDVARIGSSNQQSARLIIQATNTAGAPASAANLLYSGYEQRATGAFHVDSGKSGEEWFSGVPYAASFNNWQVGFDGSGGQAEYTANAIITAYHDKSVYLNAYGSGSYTGTAATYLAVTSSGQIIETGSGGVLPGGPYLPLAGGTMTGNLKLADNVQLLVGSSTDLLLSHNGSNSYISNYTGDLYIENAYDNGDIIFKSDNGTGGTATYFYLDGGRSDGTNFATRFPDQSIILMGSGTGWNDGAQIYHSGSNFHINEYIGDIEIACHTNNGDIKFKSDDGSGGLTEYFRVDGNAELNIFYKDVFLGDSRKSLYGNNSDLQVYHNSADSYIENYTGNFTIRQRQDTGDISFESDDGSGGTAQYFRIDGGIESLVASKDLLMAVDGDGGKIKFGASQDLQIYHSGSNSFIDESGNGDLFIRSTNGDGVYIYAGGTGSSNKRVFANSSGSVDLYYGSTKRFETTSTGVAVTGGADTQAVITGTTTAARLDIKTNSHHRFLQTIESDGKFRLFNQTTNTEQFSVASNNNATFAGDLTIGGTGGIFIPENLYHVGDNDTYIGFPAANEWRVVTGGAQRLDVTNSGVRIGGGARVTTILDEDTMSSDSATALATQQSIKAYVDSSITGSTTYRGTWDPDVSLNSGYGNPNLNTVTKQDGYYYICSANGSATPNGTGTEPNSWHTGDWVVYNSDLGSSGEWQKIDNTSVLSGTGTGQKVAKWDGSGTSETLADGPITFSNNDSAFTGRITSSYAGTSAHTLQNSTSNGTILNLTSTGDSRTLTLQSDHVFSNGNLFFGNNSYQTNFRGSSYNFDNGSATFTGDVNLSNSNGSFIYLNTNTGSTDTGLFLTEGSTANKDQNGFKIYYSGSGNTLKIDSGTSSLTNRVSIARDTGNATFSGAITFNGSLNSTGNLIMSTASGGANIELYSNGNAYYDGLSHNFRDSDASPTYFAMTSAQVVSYKKFVISTDADNALTLDQTGTDTGWSYINFNTSGTRNYFIGQDASKNFDIYNDNINATAIAINFTNNNVTFTSNVGIGTTSPTARLNVKSSGSTVDQIAVTHSGNTVEIAQLGQSANGNSAGALLLKTNGGVDKVYLDAAGTSYINGGNVGIGNTSPTYKLSVTGGIEAGGKVTYSKSYSSLNTTGNAVAGLTTGFNGASAGFEFKCYGGAGKYQRIVYSCYGDGTTWRPKKVIDEGTNDLDVSASADGTTITFTFKATSSTQSYSPRVIVEATGHSINSTYA